MDNNYKKTKNIVSMINYHFVFCPKYRRKIFDYEGVEERFKELISEICKELEIEIISIECKSDYAHLFLNCPPILSPSDVMKKLKGHTSHTMREDFTILSGMSSLWTRNFLVTTTEFLDDEIVVSYIKSQKKRD